jgi:hypothetical protein
MTDEQLAISYPKTHGAQRAHGFVGHRSKRRQISWWYTWWSPPVSSFEEKTPLRLWSLPQAGQVVCDQYHIKADLSGSGDHRRSRFIDRDRDRVRQQTLHRPLRTASRRQPRPACSRRRAAADRPRRHGLLTPPNRKCSAKPPARRGLPLPISYLVIRTVEDGLGVADGERADPRWVVVSYDLLAKNAERLHVIPGPESFSMRHTSSRITARELHTALKAEKPAAQTPKVDEKAYNAAIKRLPDKPFDPWLNAG